MKVKVRNASSKDLKALARCHMAAFPASLTSAMGKRHTRKSLEWYLTDQDAVLLMAEDEDRRALGYAGGLLVHEQRRQGSTSAMSQYVFKSALMSFVLRPWLILHPQIRKHFPYIRYFLKRQWEKLLGQKKISNSSPKQKVRKARKRSMGLVGIGVSPEHHGKGVGSALLQAFEQKARELGAECMDLSVEPDNEKAIRSYERNGWHRVEGMGEHCVMHKELG